VERDQVLLRLQAPRFEAELARARAELKRLDLARKEAQLELERAEELYERTVISAHDLEQARIDFAAVDAQYQGARAARTQAELDLHDSVIRSPLEGVVVRREAEVGQTVVSRLQSVPLLVVAEDRQMLARARVGTAALSQFAPGQSVTVVIDGADYAGVVHGLGLEPVAVTGGQPEYAVEVLIDIGAEAHGRLRAGQPATLRPR
jgi:multidrug efflux system membrane fusion protein